MKKKTLVNMLAFAVLLSQLSGSGALSAYGAEEPYTEQSIAVDKSIDMNAAESVSVEDMTDVFNEEPADADSTDAAQDDALNAVEPNVEDSLGDSSAAPDESPEPSAEMAGAENIPVETEAEAKELEEITGEEAVSAEEDAALAAAFPGLVEDLADDEDSICEDDLEDGMLFAAAFKPIQIKADLTRYNAPSGSSSNNPYFALTVSSSGTYYFVMKNITEFSSWEDDNNEMDQINIASLPGSNVIVTALELTAGIQYLIGVTTSSGSNSIYCYKEELCVKGDISDPNNMKKILTYKTVSGQIKSFTVSIYDDLCQDGDYYFMAKLDPESQSQNIQFFNALIGPKKIQGHVWSTESVIKAATCAHTGLRSAVCICGARTNQQVIPKTNNHTWASPGWKKKTAATVLSQEVQERVCSTCGRRETRKVGKKLSAYISVTASKVFLKKGKSTTAFKVGMGTGDYIKSCKIKNSKIAAVAWDKKKIKKISAKKVGTTTMTITLASGKSKNVTIVVKKVNIKTTDIKVRNKEVSNKRVTLKKGKKLALKVDLIPFTTQDKLSYKSAKKSIAAVTNKGVITAKKAGKTKITIKSGKKKYILTVTVK